MTKRDIRAVRQYAPRPDGQAPPVAQVGGLLRRYHDAGEGWLPLQTVTLVWRRGRLVGLSDWEQATIGTRRTDIAYALHYLVPSRDRSYWEGVLGLRRRPRRHERLQAFAEGYGIALDDDLVEAVLYSQRAGVRLMVDLAARGYPRYQLLARRRARAGAARRAVG